VLIFSKRIIERSELEGQANGGKAWPDETYQLPSREPYKDAPALVLANLQSMLWDKVGIVRDVNGLYQAAITLSAWNRILLVPTDRLSYELNTMVTNARLMTEAALLREESRGAHYRSDFPTSSEKWRKHIVFRL